MTKSTKAVERNRRTCLLSSIGLVYLMVMAVMDAAFTGFLMRVPIHYLPGLLLTLAYPFLQDHRE